MNAVLCVGPGQRVVAPFARQAVGARQHLATHGDAGAAARAQNDGEHDVGASRSAVGRF